MRAFSRISWSCAPIKVAVIMLFPIIVLLMIGRIVFFATLSIPNTVQSGILAIVNIFSSFRLKSQLMPFWMAWAMAIIILALSLAGTMIVVRVTEDWTLDDKLLVRGATATLALGIFYLAFRFALHGTKALQHVLTRNLAMLISFELAELRAEAKQRAQIVANGGEAPIFRLPYFKSEQEDINRLLGQSTEAALHGVLQSLEAFNNAALEDHKRITNRLGQCLAEIDTHLSQAMSAILPFCRRIA